MATAYENEGDESSLQINSYHTAAPRHVGAPSSIPMRHGFEAIIGQDQYTQKALDEIRGLQRNDAAFALQLNKQISAIEKKLEKIERSPTSGRVQGSGLVQFDPNLFSAPITHHEILHVFGTHGANFVNDIIGFGNFSNGYVFDMNALGTNSVVGGKRTTQGATAVRRKRPRAISAARPIFAALDDDEGDEDHSDIWGESMGASGGAVTSGHRPRAVGVRRLLFDIDDDDLRTFNDTEGMILEIQDSTRQSGPRYFNDPYIRTILSPTFMSMLRKATDHIRTNSDARTQQKTELWPFAKEPDAKLLVCREADLVLQNVDKDILKRTSPQIMSRSEWNYHKMIAAMDLLTDLDSFTAQAAAISVKVNEDITADRGSPRIVMNELRRTYNEVAITNWLALRRAIKRTTAEILGPPAEAHIWAKVRRARHVLEFLVSSDQYAEFMRPEHAWLFRPSYADTHKHRLNFCYHTYFHTSTEAEYGMDLGNAIQESFWRDKLENRILKQREIDSDTTRTIARGESDVPSIRNDFRTLLRDFRALLAMDEIQAAIPPPVPDITDEDINDADVGDIMQFREDVLTHAFSNLLEIPDGQLDIMYDNELDPIDIAAKIAEKNDKVVNTAAWVTALLRPDSHICVGGVPPGHCDLGDISGNWVSCSGSLDELLLGYLKVPDEDVYDRLNAHSRSDEARHAFPSTFRRDEQRYTRAPSSSHLMEGFPRRLMSLPGESDMWFAMHVVSHLIRSTRLGARERNDACISADVNKINIGLGDLLIIGGFDPGRVLNRIITADAEAVDNEGTVRTNLAMAMPEGSDVALGDWVVPHQRVFVDIDALTDPAKIRKYNNKWKEMEKTWRERNGRQPMDIGDTSAYADIIAWEDATGKRYRSKFPFFTVGQLQVIEDNRVNDPYEWVCPICNVNHDLTLPEHDMTFFAHHVMVHEIAFRIADMDFDEIFPPERSEENLPIIRDVAGMNLKDINDHLHQKLQSQTSAVGRAPARGMLFRTMSNDHSRVVIDGPAPDRLDEYMMPIMRTFDESKYPYAGVVSTNDQDEWSIWKKSPSDWAHVTESRRNYVRRNPSEVAAWGTDVLMPVATAFMRAVAKQHSGVMSGTGSEATIKFWLYDLSKIEARDLFMDLDIEGFPNVDALDEIAYPGTQAIAHQVKRIVAGEILRAVQEGRRLYYQHHSRAPEAPKRSLLTHDDRYRGLTAQLMVNFWQEAELSFPQQARHTERRAQLYELHTRRREIMQSMLAAIGSAPIYTIDSSMTANGGGYYNAGPSYNAGYNAGYGSGQQAVNVEYMASNMWHRNLQATLR